MAFQRLSAILQSCYELGCLIKIKEDGLLLQSLYALKSFLKLLPDKGERIIVDQRIDEVWDQGWIMGLLIGLLAIEWLSRKLLKLA